MFLRTVFSFKFAQAHYVLVSYIQWCGLVSLRLGRVTAMAGPDRDYEFKQDRHCTYKVTFSRVLATITALETQSSITYSECYFHP
jgi:hypothetical protein